MLLVTRVVQRKPSSRKRVASTSCNASRVDPAVASSPSKVDSKLLLESVNKCVINRVDKILSENHVSRRQFTQYLLNKNSSPSPNMIHKYVPTSPFRNPTNCTEHVFGSPRNFIPLTNILLIFQNQSVYQAVTRPCVVLYMVYSTCCTLQINFKMGLINTKDSQQIRHRSISGLRCAPSSQLPFLFDFTLQS